MSMTAGEFREEGFGQSPWIDLVNSEHWDGFGQVADHLADPTWVSLYLRHWHFDHHSVPAPLAELRNLRVFLRTLAERWATRRVLSAGDIAVINEALSVPVRRIFERDAQAFVVHLAPLKSGKKWLCAQIVESLADSFTEHGAGGADKNVSKPGLSVGLLRSVPTGIRVGGAAPDFVGTANGCAARDNHRSAPASFGARPGNSSGDESP